MLLIVNASPWGSSRASLSLRMARAITDSGDRLSAVWFSGDAAYTALPGAMRDAATVQPGAAWAKLAARHDVDLAVCSSAAARRYPDGSEDEWASGFRKAGLGELVTMMELADRVISL